MNRQWTAIAKRLGGKNSAWAYNRDRRLVIKHCGHQTAIWPYHAFFDGQELGKFELYHSVRLIMREPNSRQMWPEENPFNEGSFFRFTTGDLAKFQRCLEHWHTNNIEQLPREELTPEGVQFVIPGAEAQTQPSDTKEQGTLW